MDNLTKKEKIENKIKKLQEERKEIYDWKVDKETKRFLLNQQDEFIFKYEMMYWKMVATVDEEKQTHQIGFKQVLDEINETYDLWVKSEYDSFIDHIVWERMERKYEQDREDATERYLTGEF